MTDEKQQLKDLLKELIPKLMELHAVGRTAAKDLLGNSLGTTGRQVQNWISDEDMPGNYHAIMGKLREMSDSFSVKTIATVEQKPDQGQMVTVPLDALLKYVYEMGVKYGELKEKNKKEE